MRTTINLLPYAGHFSWLLLILTCSAAYRATAQAPPNDTCAGAIPLVEGRTSTISTANATPTSDGAETCNGRFDKGVWFTYTPPTDGLVVVDTCGSDFTTALAVYTGSCGLLTQFDCGYWDGGFCADRQVSSFVGQAGVKYYLRVGSYYSGQSGALRITASGKRVANDDCAGAIQLTSGETRQMSTAKATNAGDGAETCNGRFDKGVWFTCTPGSDGSVVVKTCGSDFTTALAVYTGICGTLTQSECGKFDTGACANQQFASFTGKAGVTYYLRVGSYYGGNSGTLRIVAEFAPTVLPTVTWTTAPPLAVTAGQTFQVAWTTTGNPTHVNIHWHPTDPIALTPSQVVPGSTSDSTVSRTTSPATLTAPTKTPEGTPITTPTAVKYVVHVSNTAGDGYSQIVSVIVGPRPGNSVIAGKVSDAFTGVAIRAAHVEAVQPNQVVGSALTDSAGNYRLEVPAGTYNVQVSASSYLTARRNGWVTGGGQTTTLNFSLSPEPATGALEILDADPRYIRQVQFPISPGDTTALEALAEASESRVGAVADGASQILLRFSAEAPGAVTFRRNNGLPGDALRRIDSSALPSGIPTQIVNGKHVAFGLYTVPLELLSGEELHHVTFAATYTPSGGTPQTTAALFRLERPPVLLIHGWGGGKGTWTDCNGDPVGVYRALQEGGFQTDLLIYPSFNSIEATGFFPFGKMHDLEQTYRNRAIALTRVDFVCHSAGGILARRFVNYPAYRRPANFYAGDIRRLITIGTPHYGTPLANALVALARSPCGLFYRAVFDRIGFHLELGGVSDLQTGSPTLQRIGETGVPSFAVVGDAGTLSELAFDATYIGILHAVSRYVPCPLSLNNSSAAVLSLAIFASQQNDTVVPVGSARGGLDKFQVFDKTIHTEIICALDVDTTTTKETESQAIANKVLSLLEGPASDFGEKLPPVPSQSSLQSNVGTSDKPGDFELKVAPGPLVRMAVPPEGVVVAPGSSLTVTVEPVQGASVKSVLIIAGAEEGFGGLAVVETAPFTATFTVPANFVGNLPISVFATDTNDNVMGEPLIRNVSVATTAVLSSLTVSPTYLRLTAEGGTGQLRVIGQFADGTSRDVTLGLVGTSYSASDTNVVRVSAEGMTVAVGNGETLVTVSNGTQSVQAIVEANFAPPTVLDVTPKEVSQGASQVLTTISGLDLGGASKLEFLLNGRPDSAISVTNLFVTGPMSLTASLSLSVSAALGPRTVVVTTPGGESETNAVPSSVLTVTAGQSEGILRFESVAVVNGQLQLRIRGPEGQACVIQSSDDLQIWMPVQTNTFSAGVIDFSETALRQRFYRVRTP